MTGTADQAGGRRAGPPVTRGHCQVDFEFVERIARTPSGKYRLTMRLVPSHAEEPARLDLAP